MSSWAPCSSTARHNRYGSPRSVTNISSRCHVLPGLRRAAFTRWAKPLPNLSHQHRIVSYVTVTPRSKSSSSMSRRLNWKRKIPSNSAADDTSRETVPVIKRFRFFHRAILRDRPNNLTMPHEDLREGRGSVLVEAVRSECGGREPRRSTKTPNGAFWQRSSKIGRAHV